jgi:peptide/nickel transport system permease protein
MSATAVCEPVDSGPELEPAVESPTVFRRLLRKPAAVISMIWLAIVVIIAVVAPIALPHIATQNAGDVFNVLKGPSSQHLLGTDSLGRDVLQRLLVGTRVTMIGVVEAVLVTLVIGVPAGLAAGYIGGRIDRAIGWLTDLCLSLPGIAVVLVVLSIFPDSMLAGMVTLGVILSPYTSRVVRSATLPIREELYIAAAQVAGLSRSYIIVRHVLSRIVGVVIVLASVYAATALVAQTGLAYLGLIVRLPAPSWGGMVGDGISAMTNQPWLIWPPGVVMTLTVVAFGLLGDAVRDATAERWSSSGIQHRPGRRRRTRTRTPKLVAAPLPSVQPSAAASGGDAASATDALLRVENLTVTFPSQSSILVVDDISFEIGAGETVGLVGESGCGKTVTAMSLIRMLPGNGEIASGRIMFDGRDLASMPEEELRRVRGSEIGLISQEPMVSLNPAFRVGWQLALSIRTHHGVSRRAANAAAIELLRSVRLPSPELVARRYPHELSGGMAQRVAIARALAGEPKLLIADEPTTALDVTVQAEILELLRELQQERGMAILLVTHDWGVVADLCDRAVVMYAGQVVEQAALRPLFRQPLHPYTRALLVSDPHNAPEGDLLPFIPGAVPKPGAWPAGCHFHPRCSYATAACQEQTIPMECPAPGRETRCIHHDQLLAIQ